MPADQTGSDLDVLLLHRMAESSEDSELAAMLDEGLFPESDSQEGSQADDSEVAEAANGDGTAAAVAADSTNPATEQQEQQAAKRPRTNTKQGIHDAPETAATEQKQAGEAVCPPHPGWWMDMCIRCGAVKSESAHPAVAGGAAAASSGNGNNGLTKIRHLHHRQALEVSCRVG